ncbi:hypothetical protein SeLEV6574_g07480 [Synchytrium endobioticum]|uniref:Uncharacterized protein n=1 Tax=Synchytrium endobioticum TaxID=286115 RepID=A0A507CHI3_9FUNG|nr:hypothetical protein SeLEV6574_g07480 [Synchytrium endobioticum]
MRTIHYLLLVVWASYCLAAPTPGRNAAARDVPTSSSASDINAEDGASQALIQHRRMCVRLEQLMQNVDVVGTMTEEIEKWARQSSAVVHNRMMELLPQHYDLSESSRNVAQEYIVQFLTAQFTKAASRGQLSSLLPELSERLQKTTYEEVWTRDNCLLPKLSNITYLFHCP